MRKILPLLLILAVVGGYTAYWLKKADDFKHMLEQSIAALNDQAKALHKDTTFIRYESIHTSGYPFGMMLVITKPVLDVPVSVLLQKRPHLVITPASPPPASPDWVEEISYGESVAVSGNITGDRFTLIAAGDRTHVSLFDHALRRSLVSMSQTPLVCHLTVEKAGKTPWTMRPIFTDLSTFLEIFRAADCDVHGLVLKEAKTGEALFSADGFHMTASHQPQGVNHALSFAADSKNAKATPAFDSIVGDYMQWVNVAAGRLSAQALPPISLSEYGNQDVTIDLHYDGPMQKEHFIAADMRLNLDVNAFDVKNALFDTALEAHVMSAPQGNDRTASLTLHGRSEVSAHYDELVARQFAAGFSEIMQGMGSGDMTQAIARLGGPEKIAAALLPKFHSLGKNTADINIAVTGPNRPDTFLQQGNYTITALNWVAPAYGIKLKGNGHAAAQNQPPSGDLTLACLSCDALIGDLGNYTMRVEAVIDQLRQPPQRPYITPDLIEGVRQFLHGIAEPNADKNAKDIVIAFVFKGTGEFTIGGKPIAQVMGLFATTIAPHLPAPGTGAETPPPPSATPQAIPPAPRR